jgi:hypothetical protein
MHVHFPQAGDRELTGTGQSPEIRVERAFAKNCRSSLSANRESGSLVGHRRSPTAIDDSDFANRHSLYIKGLRIVERRLYKRLGCSCAWKLSDLLRTGMLSPEYHGECGVRSLRELARSYLTLSKDLTRVMNRLNPS